MNLRLPKSNIAWELRDDPHGYSTELKGSFVMPDGNTLHSTVRVDAYLLGRARDQQALGDHVVRQVTEELSREVGRRMVMGAS